MVLRAGEKNLLFDSGAGTLRRLLEVDLGYREIDYLFYSHLHPDHTLDLVSILFASKNPSNLRVEPLSITGPKGLKDFYDRLLANFEGTIEPVSYKVELRELWGSHLDYEGFSLTTRPLPHTTSSIGYRLEFEDGKSFTYSGDTDYCQAIVELAKGVDLLALECSFPDEYKFEGHLTPSLAGRIAEEANVERLLLTHFYPICDEYDILSQCKKAFNGEVIIAEDLMRLEV